MYGTPKAAGFGLSLARELDAYGTSAVCIPPQRQLRGLLADLKLVPDTMQAYLSFLERQEPSSVPKRIQGRVTAHHCGTLCDMRGAPVLHVGLDPTSCTSTVAALMHWLCGLSMQVSDIGEGQRRTMGELVDAITSTRAREADTLVVVHTPHHRCALLRCGSQAVLLQSNHDLMHGDGHQFTLGEWLRGGPSIMGSKELHRFCTRLHEAATSLAGDCERLCQQLFGIPFKPGPKWDWWWAEMPVSLPSAPVG